MPNRSPPPSSTAATAPVLRQRTARPSTLLKQLVIRQRGKAYPVPARMLCVVCVVCIGVCAHVRGSNPPYPAFGLSDLGLKQCFVARRLKPGCRLRILARLSGWTIIRVDDGFRDGVQPASLQKVIRISARLVQFRKAHRLEMMR